MAAHQRDARRRRRRAIDAQIAAGDGGGGEGHVGDAGGEQAGGVEMPGDVFHADRRHQPIRRLEAGDAAEAAGRITEPPVWLPIAIGSMPAATAAHEPDDEPPGVCARLCGLRVSAGSMVANSVVTVLPMTMPPARRISATAAASARGR